MDAASVTQGITEWLNDLDEDERTGPVGMEAAEAHVKEYLSFCRDDACRKELVKVCVELLSLIVMLGMVGNFQILNLLPHRNGRSDARPGKKPTCPIRLLAGRFAAEF